MFCFFMTRRFCGGFHAKSFLSCKIAMMINFFVFLLLIRVVSFAHVPFLILCTVFYIFVIVRHAPICHVNRPLNAKVRKKNRTLSFLSFSILTFIGWLLIGYCNKMGIVILLTLTLVALNMYWAIAVRWIERRFV